MKKLIRLKEKFILNEASTDVSSPIVDNETAAPAATNDTVPALKIDTNSGKTDWAAIIKTLSQAVTLKTGAEKVEAESKLAEAWKNFFESPEIFGKGTNSTVEKLGRGVKEECFEKGFNLATNPFLQFIKKEIINRNLVLDAMQYATVHNGFIDGNITTAMLKGTDKLGIANIIRCQDFYNKPANDRKSYLKLQKNIIAKIGVLKNDSSEFTEEDAINILYTDNSRKNLRPLDTANELLTQAFETEEEDNTIDIEKETKMLSAEKQQKIKDINTVLSKNFKLSDDKVNQVTQFILQNLGS